MRELPHSCPSGATPRRLPGAKRLFDVLVTVALLPLVLPLLVLIAAGVYASVGRPVLFQQRRPGLHGRPFTLVKFRTMRETFDEEGIPFPDAQRLTTFGRLLRATSLDELPELWNVIRGEMSLVGPRPLLMEYLPRYTSRQARRHDVLPGITGLAQVSGRNSLSWNARFELDVWYVDNQSAMLDVRILCRTVAKVLRRDGIAQAGEATMTPFTGGAVAE
jgi:lipopolysaccharide/colanic/teichoic acid biosynthesis glycosyltransferase